MPYNPSDPYGWRQQDANLAQNRANLANQWAQDSWRIGAQQAMNARRSLDGNQRGYPTTTRTDGTATAALILSIASFVVCPAILAVVALAIIPGSRRTIRSSGGMVEGEGLLTAAKVISIINLGLFAIIIAVMVIAGAASSSTSPAIPAGALILG